MPNAQVCGKRESITFVYMHIGAKYMLELAETSCRSCRRS